MTSIFQQVDGSSSDGDGQAELIALLLGLDTQSFYDVVDQDVRLVDRYDGSAAAAFSEPLRSREVVERWYQALVRMKKSTEMTIAAKSADDKADRHNLRLKREYERADIARARYLRWKAGAIRFLTGVEERLTEANYWRRVHFLDAVPAIVVLERDALSESVRLLLQAIAEHRDAFTDEPTPADIALWGVLPPQDY